MNVQYLQCCLPDYFNGSPGQALAVAVDNTTTYRQLKEGLLKDLRETELYGNDGEPLTNDDYVALTHAVEALFATTDMNRAAFPELESDGCYAYFSVIVQ